MKKALLAALIATTLAGCGGGSSTSTPAVVVAPPVDAVATASGAVATQAGLTTIATSSSTQTAYDVAADIGDTWRITFDSATSTYAIKILSSQFGLTDKTGTYTATTSGNLTTYSGTDFQVTVDNRTRLIIGNIKLGVRSTSISGSGYAVADLAKLAGNYLFIAATRDASTNATRETTIGTLRVNANSTIDACERGTFDSTGKCTAFPGVVTQRSPVLASFTLSRNATTGIVSIAQNGSAFGILNVHAGDRGPVLIVDRAGNSPSGTLRVGTIIAGQPQALTSAVDGTYACSRQGGDTGQIVLSGASAQVTNSSTKLTHTETVYLNQIGTGTGITAFNGAATLKVPGEPFTATSTYFPLSSSFGVGVDSDTEYLTVCAKK